MVHLTRDPRGVLHSRLQYPRLHSGGRVLERGVEGVKETATLFCEQGVRDAEFLGQQYRGKTWNFPVPRIGFK